MSGSLPLSPCDFTAISHADLRQVLIYFHDLTQFTSELKVSRKLQHRGLHVSQSYPTDLSKMTEMLSISMSSTVAPGHMWLLSPWHEAGTSEKLNFSFYVNINYFKFKYK